MGDIKREKPPMDLFKAIFANSDSEDEDAEESDKPDDDSTPNKPNNPFINAQPEATVPNVADLNEEPRNHLRSSAPARGIFANIDLDALKAKPAAPSNCNINYAKVSSEGPLPKPLSSDAPHEPMQGPMPPNPY